ncbi:peptidase U32 family protein [Desulfoluna sp.]|uniref:peptidase U32 family protein n=1 Tax=Desulfoluna sp. TaxID=2045199 RepID=UPI00261B8461|nr:peptidase U32 family protein [Desulfoluna sp.]
MKKKIELLAPGGDIDSIKAAIAAGADAIYCGLNKFNARDRATNIDFHDFNGMVHLAHQNHCAVFLTINIMIVESEIPALIRLLNKLVNTKIDAVIVQDLGLFYLLSTYFPSLDVHASTQVNTHNEGQLHFLKALAATRANLARELNLDEIRDLTATAHQDGMETEVFVHGSYCLSFSGLCYLSSVIGGRSGNRGRCSQPCRDQYIKTPAGKDFPLNLKDNSAWLDLEALAEAGVDSLKIEGRIKKFDYVYTVVDCWRKQLQRFYEKQPLSTDNSVLYKVFNRDFSNGFLAGQIHKEMFIDNPRDHSIKQLSEAVSSSSDETRETNRVKFYEDKAALTARAKHKIASLNIEQCPLRIQVSGSLGAPLTVTVTTPETTFHVDSEILLTRELKKKDLPALHPALFSERFKDLDTSEFGLSPISLEHLQPGLFIPFRELTILRKKIAFILNGEREKVAPIDLPLLEKKSPSPIPPTLSVVLSSQDELALCRDSSADLFFKLPSCLKQDLPSLIALFLENKTLVPWFPSVLIGEDYTAAVALLQTIRPTRMVTDNTGIAHEASQNGIPWIAGPSLNIANAFSLLCLKEKFHCSGAFLSNELNLQQLKQIIRPDQFDLYFSICHPISLMTSRQCLLHQVIGCKKSMMDEECLRTCQRSATLSHATRHSLVASKTMGNYHCLYAQHPLLNTEIVADLPGMFSSFCVDLREIQTETRIQPDKTEVIQLFEALLAGAPEAAAALHQKIQPSTNGQYKKGI